jgi:hypothetical protein
VSCVCGFLAVEATIRVQLWFLVELDDLQTLIFVAVQGGLTDTKFCKSVGLVMKERTF